MNVSQAASMESAAADPAIQANRGAEPPQSRNNSIPLGNAMEMNTKATGMASSSSHLLRPEDARPTSSASRSANSTSPTASSDQSSSSSGDGEDESDDGKSDKQAGGSKRKKLDRSKLRKGKWTIEEEEFTSRIIHYFSIGLLALPEGATLRSYIAEKLNCDPMRVTKKYAGASCLGRRVFQVRDKPQPSILELQLAKAELDMLERRFQVRIEEGRPGVPLAPQFDIALALTQQQQASRAPSISGIPSWLSMNDAHSVPMTAPMDVGGLGGYSLSLQGLQSLIHGLTTAPAPATTVAPRSFNPAPQQASFLRPAAPAPATSSGNGLQLDIALAQLLLAQAAANAVKQAPLQQPAFSVANREPSSLLQREALAPPTHSFHGLQVGTKTSVGASLQDAPQSFKAPSSQELPGLNVTCQGLDNLKPTQNVFLDQLKRTYEQHLAAQAADNGSSATKFIAHSLAALPGNAARGSVVSQSTHTSADNGPSASHSNQRPKALIPTLSSTSLGAKQGSQPCRGPSVSSLVPTQVAPHAPISTPGNGTKFTSIASTKRPSSSAPDAHVKTKKVKVAAPAPPQSSEDGAIMMGFLNSLRNSFESAVAQQTVTRTREQQEDSEETNSNTSGAGQAPATVTDSSSQQQESCSSVDESDWNSEDKKADSMSSEDSDKDDKEDHKQEKYLEAVQYSKGPPRKRHKSKKVDPMIEARAV
ncbi:hypothetical protein MPSEU_000231400 [Mayamaea pseudoterrestris]|nr:hypothetical protein MPSEU_000231400 [Mayamaea pseudoterrestris]